MQEQNTNYIPPVYPADKPKKVIPTFIGIAIIIVVAVVLFGGVFAWQYFYKMPDAVSPQQIQDKTAGPALSEVEGWKTYTNSQYGFNIKYPPFVQLEINNDYDFPEGCVSISYEGSGVAFVGDISKASKLCAGFTGRGIDNVSLENQKIIIGTKDYYFRGDTNSTRDYFYLSGSLSDRISIFYYLNSNSNEKDKTLRSILSTFKFTTPLVQAELWLWPDVNSFDLTNKTFQAKGMGDSAATVKSIKVYTNSSTKISSKNTSTSISDFNGMYLMLKNWVGPEWWFDVRGAYEKDGSFLASDISITGQ